MGSYIDLPRNRGFRPPKTHGTDRTNGTRQRNNTVTAAAVGALVVTGFFLLTKPTTTNPKTTAATQATVPTARTADPRIAPPQPDNAALNETIILDSPLADSKKQETSNKVITPSAAQPFSIRILNGSGDSYSTDSLVQRLSGGGLSAITTGAATNHYDTSTIYYSGDHATDAKAVAHTLGHDSMPIEQNDIAKPADILYVIGSNEQ